MGKRIIARLTLAAATMLGAALAAAIVLAVVDLYLTGHGHASLMKEYWVAPEWGVSMSLADFILLGASFLAGGYVWWLTRARK